MSIIGTLLSWTAGQRLKASALNQNFADIKSSVNAVYTDIGSLASLTTSVKTSLVNAINELVTSIGTKLNKEKFDNLNIYNVKDYGAKGDEVTDDTAAIQACIDAAPQYSKIYFPASATKYMISSALVINKALNIEGEMSYISQTVNTANIFEINSGTLIEYLKISGFIFNFGTGVAASATTGKAITVTGGTNVGFLRLDRLLINQPKYGVYADANNYIWMSKFTQVQTVESYSSGFYLYNTAGAGTTTVLENCFVNSVTTDDYAYYIRSQVTTKLMACAADNVKRWGYFASVYIKVENCSGENLKFSQATNNNFINFSTFRGDAAIVENLSLSFTYADYSAMTSKNLIYSDGCLDAKNIEITTPNAEVITFPSTFYLIYCNNDSGLSNLKRSVIRNLSTNFSRGNSVYAARGGIDIYNSSNPTLLVTGAGFDGRNVNQHRYASGTTPAWGTFTVGEDIIYHSDPTAAGYIGRVPTISGTYGTLNSGATTGSTTSAKAALVPNAITGLSTGDYITIAGVTGVKRVRKIPTALTSTTVNTDSNSGQKVLKVAATTNFHVGEYIVIGQATAREEYAFIDSVQVGVSLTLTTNLVSTHLASDADTVKNCVELDSTCSATVASAAVAFSAPTLKTFGAISA